MPRWLRIQSFIHYHGFEPDDRSRSELLRKNDCLSYTIYDKIVSNTKDDSTLYLCKSPTNSSTFLPMINLFLFSDDARFKVNGKTKIPTTTLTI